MTCSCCLNIPLISIQLLVTAISLLYGQRLLVPKAYKWTKRVTLTMTGIFSFILAAIGILLLVLSINDDLRRKNFANFCIQESQSSVPLDEHRCSILKKGNVSGKVMEFGPGKYET